MSLAMSWGRLGTVPFRGTNDISTSAPAAIKCAKATLRDSAAFGHMPDRRLAVRDSLAASPSLLQSFVPMSCVKVKVRRRFSSCSW